MKSRWVPTDEDVRDLLAVIERCDTADDGDIFYSDVLARLRGLIPCDDITFHLMDVPEQRIRLLDVNDDGVEREGSFGAEDEFLHMFWQKFWNDDGCAGPLRTGDWATALRHSDLWTERDYANTPLGSYFVNDLGIRRQLIVPMTPQDGTDRRLLLFRDEGQDFTERELLMLRLIRPHLAELHTHRDRGLRGESNLTHDKRRSCARSPPAQATPRSPARWDCPKPRCVNTWRTSSCGCTF